MSLIARLMLPLVQLGGGGGIFLPPPVHGEGAEAAGPWPMAWGCHNAYLSVFWVKCPYKSPFKTLPFVVVVQQMVIHYIIYKCYQ